jgi:hypothetical protein
MSQLAQTRTSSVGPHVRFRRVQTLVREGSPLVKLLQFCLGRSLIRNGTRTRDEVRH